MRAMTTSNERLARIAQELAAAAEAPPDRDGRRRLPVLQPKDAADLTAMLHAQLDAAIEHRSEDAVARGLHIACARGCNACCISPVFVGEHEALAVAEWLAQPAQEPIRARFLALYPAWRATVGELPETLADAFGSRDAREGAARTYRERKAMCPFNHDGACAVYPVRPALCRKAHALDSNEGCGDPEWHLRYFEHAETEATYEAQESVRQILHVALRAGRGGELLPKAVMRRLAAAKAGRNDPCVCGSGRKLKKCCGA
jgi:Fe-S-cluster containining protein